MRRYVYIYIGNIYMHIYTYKYVKIHISYLFICPFKNKINKFFPLEQSKGKKASHLGRGKKIGKKKSIKKYV
jgi:hypothetical protein